MPVSRFELGAVLGVNQILSWGMTFYLPAVAGAAAAASLGQPLVWILGAFSWSLLVSACCAPFVGRWIDRHGGRGSLLASIVTMAGGLVILGFSTGLTIWFAGWTIIGAGMAMGLYDAAFATAGGLLGREAGPVITGITLVAGFASTVFWTAGALLIGWLGWRGLALAYAGGMLLVNVPMVWLLIPATPPRTRPVEARGPKPSGYLPGVLLLAGFFSLRWFLTSAISVNVLQLFHGIGLTEAAAVGIAALIGPSQVAGRIIEWLAGSRLPVLGRARLAALLFPLGAALLLAGGPYAAAGFAICYGMSNGIMTINRGTLPLAMFGERGYARLLGWLAVPVQVAQALAPSLAAPVMAALPAREFLLLCGGAAAVAALLLWPLRVAR
jgi:hypothetical protein